MSKVKLAAWSLSAMLAIAVPLTAEWEGKRNEPYRDIGGVLTVCYGETRVQMRRYSDAECTEMLKVALGDFGQKVQRCVPALEERPFQWGASTTLAYNIGAPGFCGSTAARRFNAGDWAGGCEAFKMWVKVNGKYVQGLANRRFQGVGDLIPEYTVCMRGLP